MNGVNGKHVQYLVEGLRKEERVYVIVRCHNSGERIARWMAQLTQNITDVTKTHAQVSQIALQ